MDFVSKNSLVSICIPTYNRPELLRAALESCFAQTYQDFEIVLGDDSKDNRSEFVAKEFEAKYPGKIRYRRNIPSLGQAANVNSLFNNANGYRLVLLHDDDLLLPNALQDLSDCWTHTPDLTAAYGKQYLMTMDGEILLKESERTNAFVRRVDENAGLVPVPGTAGIIQMFPNNGYMVLTERARAIGYRTFDEVGDACDFDFGLRLCLEPSAKIWFVKEHIAIYRFSDDALTKTAITSHIVYKLLKELKVSNEVQDTLDRTLQFFAPQAASAYARVGQGWRALRILLSPDYSLKQRLRVHFLFHCFLTFVALMAGMRGVKLVLQTLNGHIRG